MPTTGSRMRSSPMRKRHNSQAMQERLSRSFRRIPAEDTPRIFRLRLAEIEPNPNQPRKHLDPNALQELATSVKRHGLIQPITVKRLESSGRYLLVAGERRFRAHELLGEEEILAVVTTGDPDEISLIENVQREDLHPLEEAAAYARMMELHAWTQEQLAEVVGKARPTVTNILKLNNLPDAIKDGCRTRPDVSKSLLFEIARRTGAAAQLQLWKQVREGGTVRAARTRTPDQPTRAPQPDALIEAIASGRHFLCRLEKIMPGRSAADVRHYDELLVLRQEINAAVSRLVP
jgi:ParB family transcriptional regulator, chromosome partitioning protein